VTPCIFVSRYQRIGEIQSPSSALKMETVWTYTASQPRTSSSSSSLLFTCWSTVTTAQPTFHVLTLLWKVHVSLDYMFRLTRSHHQVEKLYISYCTFLHYKIVALTALRTSNVMSNTVGRTNIWRCEWYTTDWTNFMFLKRHSVTLHLLLKPLWTQGLNRTSSTLQDPCSLNVCPLPHLRNSFKSTLQNETIII
jgi:hypothetical protein